MILAVRSVGAESIEVRCNRAATFQARGPTLQRCEVRASGAGPSPPHLLFFPFSIDKEAVKLAHPHIWPKDRRWLEGLDEWIAEHGGRAHTAPHRVGEWQREARGGMPGRPLSSSLV